MKLMNADKKLVELSGVVETFRRRTAVEWWINIINCKSVRAHSFMSSAYCVTLYKNIPESPGQLRSIGAHVFC